MLAPAKINLALHVTGRRDDGYHLLDTLVGFATHGDQIDIRPSLHDQFQINGPFGEGLSTGPDNLVLRARDLLREAIGSDAFPVSIKLEKNLPLSSGIGGGSSDAASVLRLLQLIWQVELAPDQLGKIALQLGADVPMCLAQVPLIARGIGEAIERVETLPSLPLLLVNPMVALSTPAIFRNLACKENSPLAPLPEDNDIFAWLDYLRSSRNDLQRPACQAAPQINMALLSLRNHGAILVRMSGSGATCFGLYTDPDRLAQAARAIALEQPSWYVCATEIQGNYQK